jgi:hypothetical protein
LLSGLKPLTDRYTILVRWVLAETFKSIMVKSSLENKRILVLEDDPLLALDLEDSQASSKPSR